MLYVGLTNGPSLREMLFHMNFVSSLCTLYRRENTGNFEQTNMGILSKQIGEFLNKQIWLNGNDLTGNFNLTNSSIVERDVVL